jgi:hypothetical protein
VAQGHPPSPLPRLYTNHINSNPLMTRLILPLGTLALALWVGGNALSAGLQITKAYSDRLAVTMCEVSATPCR